MKDPIGRNALDLLIYTTCSWPELSPDKEEFSIPTTNENRVNVLVVAELHLKCTEPKWIEIFNEFQMRRCFQTAVQYLKPELVFVLGDVLDTNLKHCYFNEFDNTVRRFNNIFSLPNETKIYVGARNRDAGYHLDFSLFIELQRRSATITIRPLCHENWECLSKNITIYLMNKLNPRVVFSGHIHLGCTRSLSGGDGVEVTISSLNWRKKYEPTICLAVITTTNYEIVKCPMPRYFTIITIYVFGILIILCRIIYSYKTRRVSSTK